MSEYWLSSFLYYYGRGEGLQHVHQGLQSLKVKVSARRPKRLGHTTPTSAKVMPTTCVCTMFKPPPPPTFWGTGEKKKACVLASVASPPFGGVKVTAASACTHSPPPPKKRKPTGNLGLLSPISRPRRPKRPRVSRPTGRPRVTKHLWGDLGFTSLQGAPGGRHSPQWVVNEWWRWWKCGCDVIFSWSFIGGHLGRGRRDANSVPARLLTANQPQRVPLVITYNPALCYISSIINKHFSILSSSLRCSNVFKAKPFLAFRWSNNLSNMLVSAKLHKPVTAANEPCGSFHCGNNRLTWNYINDGLTTYTFNSTGETRLINRHIDCNSKNVIYMIQCNHCHKQYIGKTKRRLKDRFNGHRRPVDKQTNCSKPTTVSEHFLCNNHNATDTQLIPLELVKS